MWDERGLGEAVVAAVACPVWAEACPEYVGGNSEKWGAEIQQEKIGAIFECVGAGVMLLPYDRQSGGELRSSTYIQIQ